jgi:hypothetical protein
MMKWNVLMHQTRAGEAAVATALETVDTTTKIIAQVIPR